MSAKMSLDLAKALLTNAVAGAPVATGPLNGSLLVLFANNIIPNADTVLADLVEPTAAGYARSAAITWSGPYSDSAGNEQVVGDLKNFAFTANAVPDTIYGYGVISAGGSPKLQLTERFPFPITPVAGRVIQVAPRFGLPEAVSALES